VISLENITKVHAGARHYFFGTVSNRYLKELVFVPVIESGKNNYVPEHVDLEKNYQRPGSRSRQRRFMVFLLEHADSIVPPIILSGRGHWKFRPIAASPDLGSLEVLQPAAVIDGQHRAGGYIALFEEKEKEVSVPFILLPELRSEEERQEFLTINTTQKGVSAALQAFLGDTDESKITWWVNNEEDSPFKG